MPKRISHNKTIKRWSTLALIDSAGNIVDSDVAGQYVDSADIVAADSPTFDDSDTYLDMSNPWETMDFDEFKYWSADSDEFQAQLTARVV